jgi:predicted helicase
MPLDRSARNPESPHTSPNRSDNEEYIVPLVGQVVHVSLETVRIVSALPERYTE